jgi:hypothetical protein
MENTEIKELLSTELPKNEKPTEPAKEDNKQDDRPDVAENLSGIIMDHSDDLSVEDIDDIIGTLEMLREDLEEE